MNERQAVLVVESHQAAREALAAMLAYHGYAVTAVEAGAAAVAALRASPFPVSAALVGVGRTGLGGPATVLALQALDPQLPCLLITGGAPISAHQAHACGAADLLPKPIPLARLGRAVGAAARARSENT